MKPPKIPAPNAQFAANGQLTVRQSRRILIEMSLRRQRPGTGSSIELLRQRTAMHPWPNLRPILEGIPWAITGAVATRAYMPERMTRDIDIVVQREHCKRVWQRFQDAGYRVAAVLDAPYFVAHSPDGVEIDVICADFPWLAEALQNPALDAADYPVLALPFLILMKLMASRGVDLGDMTRMLGLAAETDLHQVRVTVQRYRPDDSEDLEALILLGQREIEPGDGDPSWKDDL